MQVVAGGVARATNVLHWITLRFEPEIIVASCGGDLCVDDQVLLWPCETNAAPRVQSVSSHVEPERQQPQLDATRAHEQLIQRVTLDHGHESVVTRRRRRWRVRQLLSDVGLTSNDTVRSAISPHAIEGAIELGANTLVYGAGTISVWPTPS